MQPDEATLTPCRWKFARLQKQRSFKCYTKIQYRRCGSFHDFHFFHDTEKESFLKSQPIKEFSQIKKNKIMKELNEIIVDAFNKYDEPITPAQIKKLGNQISMTSEKGLLIRSEIYAEVYADKFLNNLEQAPVKPKTESKTNYKEVGRLKFVKQ